MEYVYSANDGLVIWGPTGSSIRMRPNDIWAADDPFVLARPDLFSAEPIYYETTTAARQYQPLAPLPTKRRVSLRRG